MTDDFLDDENDNVDYLESPSGTPIEVSGFSIKQQQLESPFGEGDKQVAKENKSLAGKLLPPNWPQIASGEEVNKVYGEKLEGQGDIHINKLSYTLKNGAKELRYMAADHIKGLENKSHPQFEVLKKQFDEFRPQIVLHEGFMDNPPTVTEEDGYRLGEQVYMLYLVKDHNSRLKPGEEPVAIESADIPSEELIEGMRNRGYTFEELAVDDVLGKVASTVASIQNSPGLTEEEKQARLQEEEEKLKSGYLDSFVPGKPIRPTFELYLQEDGKEWDDEKIREAVKKLTGEELSVYLDRWKFPKFRQMFEDGNTVRDQYIVRQIAEATRKYDRVMTVFGSGHPIREEAALREYFDSPPDDEASTDKEKMKPTVLYHASSNRNIEVLEPRAEKVRDENEGPVVFASPDKALTTKFLVPSDDTWTRKMRFGDTHVHVISDRKRYEEFDKGGAIYHLSPEGFTLDQTKRGGKNEWTSNTSVTPTEKEEYESGLEAQLDNGVQVYFVDEETFDRITQSEDHGVAIIKGLVSENKLKNINPKEIPQ